METAYVLINCDLGVETQIINELTKIPEIKEVRGTLGVFDIFCKIEADKEKLTDIITNKIRRIPKIRNTNTLQAILSQGGR
jgi:DNA-binding Lrp family transcriptional regulator